MNFVRFILLSALLTSALHAYPGVDSLSVSHRRLLLTGVRAEMAEETFLNPALMPWKSEQSLGAAEVGYLNRTGSEMPLTFDPDNGCRNLILKADAYIHAGKSVTWGDASYSNGTILDRTLCESSDYDMVYPYVHATAKGGDLKMERYRFAGGWSGMAGLWSIGASLSYDAGLYYRQVDPRPRNRTGNLLVNVGGSLPLSSQYRLGASARLQRYTQSSDITFVSEEGRDVIYHLTGLATQYQRFAGQGSKTNYTAYSPGVGVQLFPNSENGFFAAGEWKLLSMRVVVSDINRLPLANISDNSFSLNAGWISKSGVNSLAAKLFTATDTRVGTENIFGDPSSGVYPKIGSQKMYRSTTSCFGLSLLWRLQQRHSRIQVRPDVSYNYLRQTYDGTTRLLRADRLKTGVAITGVAEWGKGFFAEVEVDAHFLLPVNSELRLPAPSSDFASMLTQQQSEYFEAISGNAQVLKAGFSISKNIGWRYAVGLKLQWHYLHSDAVKPCNQLGATIQFYF